MIELVLDKRYPQEVILDGGSEVTIRPTGLMASPAGTGEYRLNS